MNRVLWTVFVLGLLLFTFRLYVPKFERQYTLDYVTSKQPVDLGVIPTGRYTMTAVYFSSDDPAHAADVRIEINDAKGEHVYSNIQRSADRQYIFPVFENVESQKLEAAIEIGEAKQLPGMELRLWLKEVDREIYYYAFYLGLALMLGAIAAMGVRYRNAIRRHK